MKWNRELETVVDNSFVPITPVTDNRPMICVIFCIIIIRLMHFVLSLNNITFSVSCPSCSLLYSSNDISYNCVLHRIRCLILLVKIPSSLCSVYSSSKFLDKVCDRFISGQLKYVVRQIVCPLASDEETCCQCAYLVTRLSGVTIASYCYS